MKIKDILEIIETIRKKRQPLPINANIRVNKRDKKNPLPKVTTEDADDMRNKIALERARNKIQERIDQSVNPVLNGKTLFIEQCAKENIMGASLYFDKILQAFALSEDSTINLTAPRYPVPEEFASAYKHDLYEKILPLCQLAYLLENNGEPEEHAFKLTILCSHLAHEEALAKISLYLRQFSTKNPAANGILHDACLFDLPESNIQRWCGYALSTQNNDILLLNPIFRKILPHAAKIETIEQRKPDTQFNKAQKADNQQAIQDMRIEITTLTRNIKQIQTKRGQADEHKKKELDDLTTKKAAKLVALASLFRGTIFDGKDILMLQAFYEVYCSEQNKDAYSILTEHGITDRGRDIFLNLQPQNDNEAIPDIVISGDDLGYPGYFIKKLDTQSKIGAALAACLGKITVCCQYIGGIGESCAIHGITSPNGGFYVLYKGADEIIAQAWVWRSQANALCLDSIETKANTLNQIVIAMYRCLGFMLCSSDNLLGCPVSHVNVGGQSGISTQVGRKDYFASREYYRDYAGYSDSKSQLKLADANMPYLFYGEVEGQFKDIVEQQTRRYLNELFQNPLPLKQNVAIQQVIAFILQTNNVPLLDCLNQAGELRSTELKILIEMNQKFRTCLEIKSLDLQLLDEGAYCNTMNSKGLSALHIAVKNINMTSVASLIKKGINLNIQDKYGNTALQTALQLFYKYKTQSHKDIVTLLINNKAELDIKDKDENTALIMAVKNNDLAMTQYLVKQGADIETFDASMKTALFWAVENNLEAIFNYLYECKANVMLVDYPHNNSLLLIAMKGKNTHIINTLLNHPDCNFTIPNQSNETPLQEAITYLPEFIMPIWNKIPVKKQVAAAQRAVKNVLNGVAYKKTESLEDILKLLPEDKRLEVIQVTGNDGKTALHLAANKPELLEGILELLPEDKRLEAIQVTNKDDKTALHLAANNPQLLEGILKLLPEDKRIEAVQITDKDSNTALHLAVSNPQSLESILKLLPKDRLLEIVQMTGKDGYSVLHGVAYKKPQSLEGILKLLPEDKRLKAAQIADKTGNTALHLAVNNPQWLEGILKLLPENKRFEAIQVTNKTGNTALHLAAYNPQSLECILKFLPENKRLETLQMQDNFGKTSLLMASNNPQLLECILKFLPEDKRLEALQSKDKYGQISIPWVHNPQYLSILELIPIDKRFEMVQMNNQSRQMILHLDVHNHLNFVNILKRLPEDKLLAALQIMEKDGETILYHAIKHPQALESILKALPEDKLLAAIKLMEKYSVALYDVLNHPQSLECILKVLPEDKRLEVLLMKDTINGRTALHQAVKNPQSLECILKFTPEDKRLEAVQMTDLDKQTVLHLAYSDPDSLECILKFLPEDKRLETVQMANLDNQTVLHLTYSYPDSLAIILGAIPESHQIEILKLICKEDTLCDKLRSVQKVASDEFTNDYIQISKILRAHTLPVTSFFSGPETSLLREFSQSRSFEAIKNLVVQFATENQQHQLTKALLSILAPEGKNLDELCRRWNMRTGGEEHLKTISL